MSETGKAGALSRWEDEGGALPCGPQEALAADCEKWDIPPLSDAEIIQLRIRVIALENMVLGLLSKASADQLAAIEEIAEFISPRADAKQLLSKASARLRRPAQASAFQFWRGDWQAYELSMATMTKAEQLASCRQ